VERGEHAKSEPKQGGSGCPTTVWSCRMTEKAIKKTTGEELSNQRASPLGRCRHRPHSILTPPRRPEEEGNRDYERRRRRPPPAPYAEKGAPLRHSRSSPHRLASPPRRHDRPREIQRRVYHWLIGVASAVDALPCSHRKSSGMAKSRPMLQIWSFRSEAPPLESGLSLSRLSRQCSLIL
jgi:hypothetical protein